MPNICKAKLERGYLILRNEGEEDLRVSRIEIEYSIIGFMWEPTTHGKEAKRVRRVIHEILAVSKTLPKGGELRLYFGEVEELRRLRIFVAKGGKEYVYDCKVE